MTVNECTEKTICRDEEFGFKPQVTRITCRSLFTGKMTSRLLYKDGNTYLETEDAVEMWEKAFKEYKANAVA